MTGRPKDTPEPPGIKQNLAIDQMERWTTACRMWTDCDDCPHDRICERLGDFLIGYLSRPHVSVRIRILASSSIP